MEQENSQSSIKKCLVCNKKLRSHAKIKYCLEHKTKRLKDIFCSICDKRLLSNNKIGLCRVHRRALPIGKEREKSYYLKNLAHHKEVNKKYQISHKKETSKRVTHYMKERMKIDPLYKIHKRLQEYTSRALRKTKGRGNRRTVEILGTDMQTVKEHIESQFKQGMSWDNYGKYGWHIDHIIPLSSAKTFEETLELCKYTNLQPLWAYENIVKSDKFISFPFGHLNNFSSYNLTVREDARTWRLKITQRP